MTTATVAPEDELLWEPVGIAGPAPSATVCSECGRPAKKLTRQRCQTCYKRLLRGGGKGHRYCKTCKRQDSNQRYQPKGPKTRCKRRHEFTPENTYIDSRGHRACRKCKIERQRQARAAARQQVEFFEERAA